MENKFLCRKISSMLSLYIDNKVTYQQSAFIEDHLANCNECRKKYLFLKSLIKDLKSSYKLVLETARKKQEQKVFSIREHEKFLNQLYPYVDNELDSQECFEFRKYVTKSQNAQRELRNIYRVQKELRKAFDGTKRTMKKDFSRKILNKLKNNSNNKIIKIKRNLITPKTLKIAILSGLILFGGYEWELLHKEHSKPQSSQSISVNNNSKIQNSVLEKIGFTAKRKTKFGN